MPEKKKEIANARRWASKEQPWSWQRPRRWFRLSTVALRDRLHPILFKKKWKGRDILDDVVDFHRKGIINLRRGMFCGSRAQFQIDPAVLTMSSSSWSSLRHATSSGKASFFLNCSPHSAIYIFFNFAFVCLIICLFDHLFLRLRQRYPIIEAHAVWVERSSSLNAFTIALIPSFATICSLASSVCLLVCLFFTVREKGKYLRLRDLPKRSTHRIWHGHSLRWTECRVLELHLFQWSP